MKLLLPLSLCAFFVSCATTPMSRIEKNPGKYSALSPDHQALVEEGLIEEGMPKDGVLLALGNPDQVNQSLSNGEAREEWEYYSLSPVVTHRISGFWSIGRHSRYPYLNRGIYGSGIGIGPTITYLPKLSSTVSFKDGYVDGYKTSSNR